MIDSALAPDFLAAESHLVDLETDFARYLARTYLADRRCSDFLALALALAFVFQVMFYWSAHLDN